MKKACFNTQNNRFKRKKMTQSEKEVTKIGDCVMGDYTGASVVSDWLSADLGSRLQTAWSGNPDSGAYWTKPRDGV